MAVTSVDGEDRVSIAWLEGESDSSVLKIVIVDESFSLPIGVSTTILARGGEYVKISQRGDTLFVVYDQVSPVGRVVNVG